MFEAIPGGHVGMAFEPMAQQVGWIKLLNWLKKHSAVDAVKEAVQPEPAKKPSRKK